MEGLHYAVWNNFNLNYQFELKGNLNYLGFELESLTLTYQIKASYSLVMSVGKDG